jgi:hypothetical protein
VQAVVPKYQVTSDEYNFEVGESGPTYMHEFNPLLKIFRPAYSSGATHDNIFKNADFWLNKGVLI